MSIFDTITQASKAAQNAVYGEALRIVPTKANGSPNARGRVADPKRPAFDTDGRPYQPVDAIAAPDRRDVARSGMGDVALHSRSMLTMTIDNPPVALRNDDMVYRAKTETWHQITDVAPDGTGSFILSLAIARNGPPEE